MDDNQDHEKIRVEINNINDKIRKLNQDKKQAESDLKRPEKAEIFEDIKEDIEMYEGKILEFRNKMIELQELLPPIDYDKLLGGEYKMQQLAELGGKRGAVPLIVDMNLDKRENAAKPEFPYYRNIYWGDLSPIEGCGLWNFREKQLVPKCLYPIANAIFMQHVFPELANYNIKPIDQFSCEVNECLKIEIHVGKVLEQDGAVVGYLHNRQPAADIQQYLPNWNADYKLFMDKSYLTDMQADADKQGEAKETFDINDGGIVPCTTTGGLSPATHLILCHQPQGPNLDVGVASILNCLDAAEVMEVQKVNLPVFPSLPSDQNAEQMVFQTIEFACTIKAKDKLNLVRLVCPDQAMQQRMAQKLAAIIQKRS